MTRRVFVAGRGAVSAFGVGVATLLDGNLGSGCGIAARVRTARFEAPTEVAGEFPYPRAADDESESEETSRLLRLAGRSAANEALEEARASKRRDVGLVLATTKADLSGIVGPGDGLGRPIRLAREIAQELGIEGPVVATSTACASGLTAIALAARRIALGEIDGVLVLGIDVLNRFIMAGFGAMGILDPTPCRPFDAARRGITLGDGAGALLLTADERRSIGVRISGHGGANEATTVTGCHREGLGVQLAVRRALAGAKRTTGEVDFLHLHGTGTKANDFSEAAGLGVVFGGTTPPAFGSKSQMGHTLGAAGALETIVAIGALQRASLPTSVGLRTPNVDERLSLTRSPVSLARSRCALKVSGGFGGIYQAVVIES